MVQFATQLTDNTIKQVIVHISYTEYYPNRTKPVEKRPIGDISLTPKIKVPSFTKLTSAQQQYVQISYTEFHPNCKINVENKDRYPFTPTIKCGFHCANFHETRYHSINFVDIPSTEFHGYRAVENSTEFHLYPYDFHFTQFSRNS